MEEHVLPPEKPVEEPAQSPDVEQMVTESGPQAEIALGENAGTEPPAPPVVEKTAVENSVALSVSAEMNAEVENSMVMAVVSGRDMTAVESMTSIAVVGRDLKIEKGGAGFVQVGGKAQVENGTVGLLIARSEVILNNSRVIMTTRQALALGAAFGAVFALLRRLLGGSKRR